MQFRKVVEWFMVGTKRLQFSILRSGAVVWGSKLILTIVQLLQVGELVLGRVHFLYSKYI